MPKDERPTDQLRMAVRNGVFVRLSFTPYVDGGCFQRTAAFVHWPLNDGAVATTRHDYIYYVILDKAKLCVLNNINQDRVVGNCILTMNSICVPNRLLGVHTRGHRGRRVV